MPRTAPEVVLDRVQREQLEALTRASSASQTEVLRARIILLAALNWQNEEIAVELRTTVTDQECPGITPIIPTG